jgi:hypothetical protein
MMQLTALLTNIKEIAKTHKPHHFGKDTFFDKKWGRNTAFQKNLDRTDYEQEDSDDGAETQLRDEIINRVKAKGTGGAFVAKMANESVAFLNRLKQRQDTAARQQMLCNQSMTELLSLMFELIKSYSYDYNNAVGYGPLHIAITHPQTVTEVMRYDRQRNPLESITYFRARISTSSHSLVIRGQEDGIVFFILPVARALGLTKQETNYEPATLLRINADDSQVHWETKLGTPLTPSQVEQISMALFQWLIEETKAHIDGQAS